MVEFGPKRDWTPIFSLLRPRLTTPPELQSSSNSLYLRSFGAPEGGLTRSEEAENGVQSRFGPNSTVELEAVFRKKFGVAYCTTGTVI